MISGWYFLNLTGRASRMNAGHIQPDVFGWSDHETTETWHRGVRT
jgi:hypothetical protein